MNIPLIGGNNKFDHKKGEFQMKRFYKAFVFVVILSFILTVPALANNAGRDAREGMNDVVSGAEDAAKDAVTDIEGVVTDALDPENGEPEAEEDGIVDDDKGKDTSLDNKDDNRPGDTTNEQPSTNENGRDTADANGDASDRNNADTNGETADRNNADTTDDKGVIEGMELEENGINPWAIVIAVIVVIAVLVLIFILIPRKRR